MAFARSRSQWRRRTLIGNANRAMSPARGAVLQWRQEKPMTRTAAPATYKSPLHEMTQSTPTCLWNDSASIPELTYSIEHGAVGATCNPVIVLGVLKKEMSVWKDRIRALIEERPAATEDQSAWQLAREVSVRAASLLKPVFDAHRGRNGRL